MRLCRPVVLVDYTLIFLLFVFFVGCRSGVYPCFTDVRSNRFYFLIQLYLLVFLPSLSLSHVQKLKEQNQSVVVESEGKSPC